MRRSIGFRFKRETPLSRLTRGIREESDIRWLFNFIDVDKSGTVDRKELMHVLSTVGKGQGRRLSLEQIDSVLLGADSVGYDGFKAAIKKYSDLCAALGSSYRVMFVTGGPGSGKGTLCGKLVENRTALLEHISSGDLLRDEVKRQTELGKHVQGLMSKGELVSASIVLALLDARLSKAHGKLVLLDGFPRSLQNAEDFYRDFGPAEGLLLFDCPEEEMVRRIVERGKLSGRADDNEATARQRVQIFKTQSEAPTKYLLSKSVPLIRIDATLPIEHNLKFLLEKFQ